MRFASLGSGSEGNALVVEAGDGASVTRVLIDCGFGIREAERRLQRLGLSAADLHAIVVTHEHGDHVAGVFALARRHRLPLHLTFGTARACAAATATVDPALLRRVDPHRAFVVRDLSIEPFSVPHDAREPVQYVLDDGRSRLGVLTDIGRPTDVLPQALARLDALVLECNHDPGLLADSAYPASLKRRIAGRFGHLCNADAGALLAGLDTARLGRVVAAHLSRTNNRPELARAALADALAADPGDILVADQDAGLAWQDVASQR